MNHHGWTLIHKNNDYKKYINYWLFNNQERIYNSANGSAQKGINKEQFFKIKIKIPKNKQLIQELELVFQQIETLQNEVKIVEELYKQLIQELSQEAIPQQTNTIIQPPQILEQEQMNEIVEEIETVVPNKKKVVKKPKTKPLLIVEEQTL